MDQDKAFAILQSGRNVFVTGAAGSGKTFLLRKYIRYLHDEKVPVAVTASTGIAATHLDGQTIHSWSGMGIKDAINENDLRSLYKYKYLRKNLEKVQVLIVDEISMLHKKQLDIVNDILRFFKGVEVPFGGIQVVFCGDFFQLPPIDPDNVSSRHRFSFMSECWVRANLQVCYLTQQYRQCDDTLGSILTQIRNNNSVDSYNNLASRSQQNMELSIGFNPEEVTKLFTHNIDIDRINNAKIAALAGKEHIFIAKKTGNDRAAKNLQNSVLAPPELVLKKYAKVLFVKNNPGKRYMNGTLGEVVGFNKDNGNPSVKVKERVIVVESEVWQQVDDEGKILASYTQIPLRLAWAITVHKSQGMTLDAASIDLSKAFEYGQGYVALSRLRNIDSLYLLGINDAALQVDPLAVKVEKRFQELSDEADSKSPLHELALERKAFLNKCRQRIKKL